MPRYFFNIEDHVREPDDDGTELADTSEARLQAIVFLAAVLRDEPYRVWDGSNFSVKVVNERGEAVVDVTVRATDRGGA